MAELNVASASNDDLRSILTSVYGLDEKEIKGLERNHLVSRIEKILASQGEGQLQNAPAAAAPAAAAPAAAAAKLKIERTGVVQKIKKASAAVVVANREKPPQHPLPSAAVKNCGGVLSATFLEIPGNGDCLYISVLQGLERHPCGNLITKTRFYSSVAALRTYVVTDPIFTECFGNIYDILNSTSIEDLRVLADTESGMNDMYPWWTINWIIEEKEKEKENKKVPSKQGFIDEARKRVSTTAEYAMNCEVSIIRSELEKKGIAVNIVTSHVQDNGTRIDPLPATVEFGTTEHPIITLLYNGRNHYDALIHVAGSRGGKSKSKKSKRSKSKKSKTRKSKSRKSKNRK